MPYLGNEVAPLVQALEGKELKLDSDGDSSIQASTDDTVVFKTNGSNRWTLNSSGNLFPASTSQGIVLGATSDTSANRLEDYEEGTWTPAIIGATTAGSSPTGVGSYTKVGKLVTATATFGNVTVSGAAGNTYISGLPYSASNGSSGAAHGAVGTSNYGTDILIGSVLNGETVIRIRGANTTVYKTISNAASIYFLCTVSYETST